VILLVACGNLLRRDDGAGLVLADRLAGRCRFAHLEIHLCHQLTVDLASRLAAPDVAAVLFADAADGEEEGRFAPPLLRRLTGKGGTHPLGHHLTPEGLLALCASLYGRSPAAWQVVIPGVDFGFGEGLSPVAEASLAGAEAEIRAFLAGAGPHRDT
jgi:hydrogenase maturation protease